MTKSATRMSKSARRIVSGLLVFLLGLWLADCQDGGSELPNELHGAVVSKHNTPAANVKVGLYSVNYIPADSGNSGLAWTTQTDAGGNYTFKNVPSGRYNLVGVQDSLGFFRDSISVSGAAEVGRDSLGLLGTLVGTVRLQPQDEPRNAVVQVMGTDNYVNVDSAGEFTLSGLAGGFYRLRVSVALPDYVPLFKEVQVHGGRHDTLPVPLAPFFSGIPVVLNITTSLDTARGIAKITWDPVSYPALLTYLVYRDGENTVNLSTTPINVSRIEDPVFYDTLYRMDAQGKTWDDSMAHNLEYRVRVQATNARIGEPYKPAVLHAVSPTILSTRISILRLGGKADEVFKGDTSRFVADYDNPLIANRRLIWIRGVSDTLRKVDLAGKAGRDTLVWAAATAFGMDSLRVEITDANGKTWSAMLRINLVASRVIGNIDSSFSTLDAYAWQGNILHVGRNFNGKIVIGIFNLTTRKDSVLNAIATSDTLSTAFSGTRLYLVKAGHPDFPGANVLSFDLQSRVWGKEPNLADAGMANCAAALDGKLYAFTRYGIQIDSLNLSILDLAVHAWTVKKMNRKLLTVGDYAMMEQNGDIYLSLSMNGPYLTSYERFDAATDKWTSLPALKQNLNYYGSRLAGLNGKLYNLAGKSSGTSFFPTTVDRFDPPQNRWNPAPDFLIGRGTPGVVGVGSSLYILGGHIMNGYTTTVEEYHPE